MQRLRRRLVMSVLLLAANSGIAAQTSTSEVGSLVGVVVHDSTGMPIAGASLFLQPSGLAAATGADGRFSLATVPAGPQELTVSVVGFILVKRTIEIRPGRATEVTIPIAEGTGTYRETVSVRADPAIGREVAVPTQDVLSSGALQNLRSVLLDDPLRAVQTLPGVAATDDLHSVFAVRGSDPGHLGFVVDGIPTRFLLHTVQAVDGGGSVSMISGDVLEQASLLSGAYPQRFGNRIGSQLEFDLREGSRDRRSARVGVSGSSVSMVAEGPLGRSKRGSWLVSGRKSYLDWLVSRVFDDPSFAFGFEDAQVKAIYDITPRQRLEFVTVGGRAIFADTPEQAGSNDLVDGHSRNWLSGVRWRLTPGSATVIAQQVYGVGAAYRNLNKAGVQLDRGSSRDIGYRGTLTHSLTPNLLLDMSAQAGRAVESRSASRQRFESGPFVQDQEFAVTGTTWGAHVQARWTPTTRVSLVPGVRIDRWATLGRTAASPWVGAEWRLSATTRLTAGTGIYRQAPRLDQVFGRYGNRLLRPERADHYDVGIEQISAGGLRWRATVYRREERDVVRASGTELRLVGGVVVAPSAVAQFANTLAGRAEGVELLIGRNHPNGLSGWLAYSYGTIRYRDLTTGERFSGDFEAPHGVNAYVNWRLSDRTSVVTRFRAASNFPLVGYLQQREVQLPRPTGGPGANATPPFGGALPPLPTVTGYFLAEERNRVRLPFYSRLDVRANRTFQWSGRRLTLFTEVTNVYNRANLRGLGGDVNGVTGRVSNATEELFPILPSAGLLIEF